MTYSHLHVFLTNMAECLFSVAAFSSHVLRVLPMGARLRQASSVRGESTCAFPADYVLPSAGLKAQLRSIQLKGAVDSGIQPCAFSDFNEG